MPCEKKEWLGNPRLQYAGEFYLVMNRGNRRKHGRIIAGRVAVWRAAEADGAVMHKAGPEKYALAWGLRPNTVDHNGWIKERRYMGKATEFAEFRKKLTTARRGPWGGQAFAKVKNIKT